VRDIERVIGLVFRALNEIAVMNHYSDRFSRFRRIAG
jgi:hypothetical protein